MRKAFTLVLLAFAIMIVGVSCDDPKHEHSYSTEWKYDNTNHWHECECGEKIDIAEHKFEVSKDNTESGKFVKKCTVCGYKSDEKLTHVDSLADIAAALGKTADFASNSTSTDAIEIDGDNKYVVDTWQDLWFGGDVTIKNVIFAKGLSLSERGSDTNTSVKTVTFEGCTIYWCDQKNDLLPQVDKNNNFRIDNSGNGQCLNISGGKSGNIIVKVLNCAFVGENDPTAARKDSFKTTKVYLDYKKDQSSIDWKGRGNGVAFGNPAGNGEFLKSAVIENCSFTGLRNAAIQIYNFTAPVTISNCDFESWGVNAGKTGQTNDKASAIRGTGLAGSSIKIENCYFNSNYVYDVNLKCEVDGVLKDTGENKDKWTQSTDGKWSANASYTTT